MSTTVAIGRCVLFACAISGLLGIAPASTTRAQEPNLSGKTVEFVIPFAESGGSAQWANFLAPLLSQHLPGKPTAVVRYRPGAGSTQGANWFQKQTTNDGTLIFGPSASTQFPYLLGDPRVRYEYKDWKVVLASGTGGVVYLQGRSGLRRHGRGEGRLMFERGEASIDYQTSSAYLKSVVRPAD